MIVAQQNDDSLSDGKFRTLYNQQVNQGGYFLLSMGGWKVGKLEVGRYKVQSTRYKVQGTRYKVQGTRYKVQGTR